MLGRQYVYVRNSSLSAGRGFEPLLEIAEFTKCVIINSLSSVEVFLEVPKGEFAPQGIWKVDIHVMRQLNTILALDYVKNTAFRESNGEQTPKEAIGRSPSPKCEARTIHVVKAPAKDRTDARDAFPLGERDTRVRQVFWTVEVQPEVLRWIRCCPILRLAGIVPNRFRCSTDGNAGING